MELALKLSLLDVEAWVSGPTHPRVDRLSRHPLHVLQQLQVLFRSTRATQDSLGAPAKNRSLSHLSMTSKGEDAGASEPVMGIPVNQNSSHNTLQVVSEGFCVPHDVVFVLQSNINPRSTEIYSVIDSAGAPQFRQDPYHPLHIKLPGIVFRFSCQAALRQQSTDCHLVYRVFAVSDSGSRMHIVDKEGRVILTLKSKFFSAHNKWYIYSGNSTHKEDKIATVKPQTGSVSAEVWLTAHMCALI